MKTSNRNIRSSESGLVSIMVTIIVMVVISLVVLGFARIVRREQRQSLDAQLSTQAFYAAETGVNDAVKVIQAAASSGTVLAEKTTCGPGGDFNFSYDIDASSGIAYTCLLVDTTPPELKYENISPDKRSTVIPIIPATTPSTLKKINISWQNADSALTNASGCSLGNNFPAAGSWPANCNPGILRVDLVPTGGSFSRSDLLTRTLTTFLYPVSSGGAASLAYGAAVTGFGGQGVITPVNCTNPPAPGPRMCTIEVTGLDSMGAAASTYMMRIRSIYRPSALTISAEITTGTTDLFGAQATIDSTGKANDILRRIKVHVPIGSDNTTIFPEFGIETTETLCKRMRVAPGIVVTPTFDPINPACSP